MRLLLAVLLLVAALPASAQKRIALTFDDVPRGAGAFLSQEDRTRRLIGALRRAGVRQAAFFVNSDKVVGAAEAQRIDAYVRAGHVIANHSASHPQLTATTVDAYLADVDRGDRWLRARAGYRAWFRYPYLDEGRRDVAKRDAVRSGLAARGFRDAYVTVDGYDWALEGRAVAAAAVGKRIDRRALRDLYVETNVGAAEFFDALAVRATGRSPAHVLLLHETDLAALYIGDLVRALKARGWQIVTADEAYADPIAAEASRYETPSAQGTLTEMLAWQARLPAPRWYERNDEAVLDRLFATRVLHEGAP